MPTVTHIVPIAVGDPHPISLPPSVVTSTIDPSATASSPVPR